MSSSPDIRQLFKDENKRGVPAAIIRMAARNSDDLAIRLKYQGEPFWARVRAFRHAPGSKPQELWVCVAVDIADGQLYRVAYDLPNQTAYVLSTLDVEN